MNKWIEIINQVNWWRILGVVIIIAPWIIFGIACMLIKGVK